MWVWDDELRLASKKFQSSDGGWGVLIATVGEEVSLL